MNENFSKQAGRSRLPLCCRSWKKIVSQICKDLEEAVMFHRLYSSVEDSAIDRREEE